MARGFNQAGYNALNLGVSELRQGLKELRAYVDELKMPLVSANVQMAGGEKALWQSWLRLEIGGVSVAVTGVVAQNAVTAEQQQQLGIIVTDPLPALQQVLSRIRSKVDAVVVLADTGLAAARKIAQHTTGIDLLLVGGGGTRNYAKEHFGTAWLLKNGKNGALISTAQCYFADGRMTEVDDKIVPLDKGVKSNFDYAEPMLAYRLEVQQFKRGLRRMKEDKLKKELSSYRTMSPQEFMQAMKKKQVKVPEQIRKMQRVNNENKKQQ